MDIKKRYITPNKYSRPQTPLKANKGVVIHWVANPGSSPTANRNYFENRKYGKTNFGSAHEIIRDDEVVIALPSWEMGYGVGSQTYTPSALRNLSSYPNNCTYHIELCHDDWSGKPSSTTWHTAVMRTVYHLKRMGLDHNDVWTHKMVVGWKNCHKWFVENKVDWVKFISEVAKALNGKEVTIPTPEPIDYNDLEHISMLNEGDRGSEVKLLQKSLNKLGFSVGAVDGIFGPKTERGVRNFQRSAGITVDGIVGPETTSHLEKALEDKSVKPQSPKVVNGSHVIQKGDTLWDIADDHGTTVEKLMELNKGIEAKRLKIGDKVKLPGKKTPNKPKPGNTSSSISRNLRMGSKGSEVRVLQNKLNSYGFSVGKVDGIFGPQTQTGVKQFQKANRLAVDGIVGPNTRKALNSYKKKVKSGYKGKRVESHYDGVIDFYSKATWNDSYKVGHVTKGQGFPYILAKVNVDGHDMYRVKNSNGKIFYITAHEKFVHVE